MSAAVGVAGGPGAADDSGGAGSGGSGGSGGGDVVELVVPADPAYLSVLRTATAGLAARLDLTIDEIEDLRIAVDEACALVLGPQALDGSTERHGVEVVSAPSVEAASATSSSPAAVLQARFDLGSGGLRVQVSGPATTLPGRESFAWAVLEALVSGLETGRDELGRHCIRLRHDGPRRSG